MTELIILEELNYMRKKQEESPKGLRIKFGTASYWVDKSNGYTYYITPGNYLGDWAGIYSFNESKHCIDRKALKPLENGESEMEQIVEWLEETNHFPDDWEDGKHLPPAELDYKRIYTYKLAPERAISYLVNLISSGKFKASGRYGWQKNTEGYQVGYHDPTKLHIRMLFHLFRKNTNRTLTLTQILENMGNERHKDRHGNKWYENRENDKYWKDLLRELYRQRLIVKLP
jgi:hypothetical protein